MSRKPFFSLFIALFLVTPVGLIAQNPLSDLELFIENEDNANLLELKLDSDWKLLRKNKLKPKYQAGHMTFFLENGDSSVVDVKIKPRGEFRRKHCLFPPIWVNFKKSDFEQSSISKYDKIKLVTHCRDAESYKQQMMTEYYIYKIYEFLTDYSFRTRLVKINYVDTLNKRVPGWNYGFFIETEAQMAERNNTVAIESKNMHPERLNRELTTVMDLFQYMIGNTDWSVVVGHNIKLLKSKDPANYVPIGVPYDFDYCGLVNASYAVPPEQLDIEKVTDRIYRGYCRTEEEFKKAFAKITEHREEILELFRNSAYLDDRYKTKALGFMEESLDIIGNPNMAKREILEMCRTAQ